MATPILIPNNFGHPVTWVAVRGRLKAQADSLPPRELGLNFVLSAFIAELEASIMSDIQKGFVITNLESGMCVLHIHDQKGP